MFTALAILGIIALICLIMGIVLVTVRISDALSKQADVLDRAHERWVRSLDPLFDRLMAHNWEEYVTIRQMSEEQEGEFLAPDEQDEDEEGGVEMSPMPLWGSIGIPRPTAEEQRLLAEDFNDEDEPVRRIPT